MNTATVLWDVVLTDGKRCGATVVSARSKEQAERKALMQWGHHWHGQTVTATATFRGCASERSAAERGVRR